jgi:hypothetical protein
MDEGLPPSVDAKPEELNAAARALRELGVEPVPRDVAVRLERRLDDELGPAPPVRRKSPRRSWRRMSFALVPLGAAAAAAIAVTIALSGGSSNRSHPTAVSAPAAVDAPTPTQGVAAGGAAAAPAPLPKRALDSDLDQATVAHAMSEVADASKAAAIRAKARLQHAPTCKGTKKTCPKPKTHTATTP